MTDNDMYPRWGEACGKTEWQVREYFLMLNHFYLVLETPQPNLVFGMKWLLGVYTKRFNIRPKLCGHLFAGRSRVRTDACATSTAENARNTENS